MTHKRTSIRTALVTLLSGQTDCGTHVYGSRLKPLGADELPAILVSTGSEDNELNKTTGNAPWLRRLEVRLDIIVKAVNGYEDAADAILAQIEARVFDTVAHNNLGGYTLSIELASIGDPDMDDSTEKPVIRLPVILRVNYL